MQDQMNFGRKFNHMVQMLPSCSVLSPRSGIAFCHTSRTGTTQESDTEKLYVTENLSAIASSIRIPVIDPKWKDKEQWSREQATKKKQSIELEIMSQRLVTRS